MLEGIVGRPGLFQMLDQIVKLELHPRRAPAVGAQIARVDCFARIVAPEAVATAPATSGTFERVGASKPAAIAAVGRAVLDAAAHARAVYDAAAHSASGSSVNFRSPQLGHSDWDPLCILRSPS